MSDRQDVSGVWYGRWRAEHPAVAPGSFIALLEEEGGGITGTITEPDPDGDDGVLRALVGGQRAGADISWVKQYDGAGRLAHAVRYAGSVNADATEIVGRWQLEGFTGSFAMNREKFDIAELEKTEALRIPLPGL